MTSERPLAGRVAVVTGAGRGIGAASARALAARGARVALCARTRADLERVAGEVEAAGGEALVLPADVSAEAEVEGLFARVAERWGAPDVLVNDAATLTVGPLHDLPTADWERMLAVNVTGVFLCCRAALARMRPAGRGVIVNVASVSGVPGVEKLPGLVAYAATKGAVLALTEALAAEQAGAGVRVVAVSPGAVDTAMLRSVAPEAAASAMRPEQVAEAIAWLASDAASAVTKTNLVVWGPPAAPDRGPE